MDLGKEKQHFIDIFEKFGKPYDGRYDNIIEDALFYNIAHQMYEYLHNKFIKYSLIKIYFFNFLFHHDETTTTYHLIINHETIEAYFDFHKILMKIELGEIEVDKYCLMNLKEEYDQFKNELFFTEDFEERSVIDLFHEMNSLYHPFFDEYI